MVQKRIVIFGAGKIGRSFIGQLFSRGGYEIVFIDINRTVIQALNKNKQYPVIIKDEKEKIIWVKNVSGIQISDTDKVVKSLISVNLAAICVGIAGLAEVAGIIAPALVEREKQKINDPLDIILAENLRNAGEIFYQYIEKHLPQGFNGKDKIGLIETSIGKMVPLMLHEITNKDPLLVYAEAYNDLIVDARGFKNEIPHIEGLMPKENMKAWVDRKLFIHNLGHAAAAYFGNYYFPSKIYIWEILEIPEILKKIRDTMDEAGTVLQLIHPGEFSLKDITEHKTDLLRRFSNRSLGDTVFRVGADLKRKMDYDDRMVAPLRMAYKNKLPYENILSALICGCHFNAANFDGKRFEDDLLLTEEYKKNGIAQVLVKYCKLDPLEYSGIFGKAEMLKL